MATAYGLSDITVRLVESEQSPGLGWPYLSFTCHCNDLALGVHYRVTIQHPLPEPERLPRHADDDTCACTAPAACTCADRDVTLISRAAPLRQRARQERLGRADDAVVAQALGGGDHRSERDP